jgi:CheY-like chemotaxis protein
MTPPAMTPATPATLELQAAQPPEDPNPATDGNDIRDPGPTGRPEPARTPPAPAAPARSLLVLEAAGGGLLTLLAHSAVSDLANTGEPVSVSTAVTGEQGITALEHAPYEGVVLDMAAGFALDFLDQIAHKAKMRDMPVLALDRDGRQGQDAERLGRLCAALATLEVLPSLDDMRERITSYLSGAGQRDPLSVTGPRTGQQAPPRAAGRGGLRGRKVLVIDDDPRNVFALSSTLKLHGMSVTEATSGQAGINELLAAPDTDVVLMDIMMPGMDGYAAMTVIRQMPEFSRLPIIAVTARAMPGDREKSIGAGATDHVTKPVDSEKLLACIERWCSPSTSG